MARRNHVGLALVAWCGVFLTACGDDCTKYSDYNCKQLAKATYNVWVDLPERGSKYAGQAVGLDGCEDIADEYAMNDPNHDGWSYICCLQTKDSSCAEKHR